MVEHKGLPSHPHKVVDRDSPLGRYFVFTLVLVIVAFVIARMQGQQGSELEQTAWSTLYASVCAIPVLWLVLKESGSFKERVMIGLWWPLKVGFIFYYYFGVWDASHNPNLYLSYSDNLSWHVAASSVADYWQQHGVGLIPKDILIRMSMNYPGAGYLFGGVYYCFGRHLGAILPWLSLVAFLSAPLGQRLFQKCGLPQAQAKVVFHLLLWSPVLWVYTLLVQRDPLISFCWLLIAYNVVRLFQQLSISNLLFLGFATLLLVNLRSEYLYVMLVWLMVVGANSLRRRHGKGLGIRVTLLSVVIACIALVGWSLWGDGGAWYVSKYDLGGGVAGQVSKFMENAGSGSGIYGSILALGGLFLIPVILPFKLLVAVTAPFPWRFSSFELLVTQPFYSLESILRLTLVFFSLRVIFRWRSFSRSWSVETKLALLLGTLVLVAGLLGPKSEVRYITPAIPLLTPLFAPYAHKLSSWPGGVLFAVIIISGLYVLYAIFR